MFYLLMCFFSLSFPSKNIINTHADEGRRELLVVKLQIVNINNEATGMLNIPLSKASQGTSLDEVKVSDFAG